MWVVCVTFLVCSCFEWLSNRTKLWAFTELSWWCLIQHFQKLVNVVELVVPFWQLPVGSSHTHSCRNHPIIGAAPWFSYLYTKHKSLCFAKTHVVSHTKLYHWHVFVSVTKYAPPTIICNTLWFSSLEVWRQMSWFWQVYIFFKSGRFFAVNTPNTPTCAFNVCCFCYFSWLSML